MFHYMSRMKPKIEEHDSIHVQNETKKIPYTLFAPLLLEPWLLFESRAPFLSSLHDQYQGLSTTENYQAPIVYNTSLHVETYKSPHSWSEAIALPLQEYLPHDLFPTRKESTYLPYTIKQIQRHCNNILKYYKIEIDNI